MRGEFGGGGLGVGDAVAVVVAHSGFFLRAAENAAEPVGLGAEGLAQGGEGGLERAGDSVCGHTVGGEVFADRPGGPGDLGGHRGIDDAGGSRGRETCRSWNGWRRGCSFRRSLRGFSSGRGRERRRSTGKDWAVFTFHAERAGPAEVPVTVGDCGGDGAFFLKGVARKAICLSSQTEPPSMRRRREARSLGSSLRRIAAARATGGRLTPVPQNSRARSDGSGFMKGAEGRAKAPGRERGIRGLSFGKLAQIAGLGSQFAAERGLRVRCRARPWVEAFLGATDGPPATTASRLRRRGKGRVGSSEGEVRLLSVWQPPAEGLWENAEGETIDQTVGYSLVTKRRRATLQHG